MRESKLRAPMLVLAAAGALALGLALGPRRPPAGLSLAGPAPAFRLSEIGGRVVSLSQFKGEVVLLNFWATWCDSCREEMPGLEALYRRHRGKGFALLALSADEDGRKAVIPFVAGFGPSFPILISDARTLQAYEVRGLPTSFLVDAQGRIARKYVGPIDIGALENDILKELAKKAGGHI